MSTTSDFFYFWPPCFIMWSMLVPLGRLDEINLWPNCSVMVCYFKGYEANIVLCGFNWRRKKHAKAGHWLKGEAGNGWVQLEVCSLRLSSWDGVGGRGWLQPGTGKLNTAQHLLDIATSTRRSLGSEWPRAYLPCCRLSNLPMSRKENQVF